MQNDVNVRADESLNASESTPPKSVTGHLKLPYLPGIDGLRAIAVLAVMFYHAEVPWMPGGFLGVEVFFVISGYLITGLLLAEWRKNHRIHLGRFWFRRARRLLPAVFLLLLAVLLYAVVFLPSEVASLRLDVLAAAAYVSNWYQVFSHKSYFEAIGRPPLLRHLWSLAVEEQFYLLWPVILAIALRWFHPRNKLVFPLLTIGLASASIGLMAALYQPDLDPSRVYYGTDTRAAGFLIGAALAMLGAFVSDFQIRIRGTHVILDACGAVALLGLLVCFVKLDEINPLLYPGGFTLVSVLTMIAIMAVISSRTGLLSAVMGNRLLVWIGLRSYGVYLWHWPIFDLTRPHLDVALDGLPLLILRFGLAFVCAELSYRFVERPIRDGAIGRLWMKMRLVATWQHLIPWTVGAVASLVMAIALVISVVNAKPADNHSEYAEQQPTATLLSTPQATNTATPGSTGIPTQLPTQKPTLSAIRLASPTVLIVQTPYQAQWPYALLTSIISASVTADAGRKPEATSTPAPPIPTETATSMPPASTPITATPTLVAIPDIKTQTVTDVLGSNYHILAIGDSVMLGASQDLQKAFGGAEVDAVVSRQAVAAISVLQQRHDAGTLGDIVVLHIGSNGFVTQKQFDVMLQTLSEVRIVVVVNVRVPRRWEGPNNSLFDESVKRTPNAVLVDWYSTSEPHPELFVEDGVHLQPAGRQLYAQLIVAQVKAFDIILKQKQGTNSIAN